MAPGPLNIAYDLSTGILMPNRLQAVSYMIHHDPAAVAGWILIGGSAVLHFHTQLKMLRAGHLTSVDFLKGPWGRRATPARYLKLSGNEGWSRWPAYLSPLCLLVGFTLVILGLFRL